MENPPDVDVHLEEPLAALERELINAFLAGGGHDMHTLLTSKDPAAHALLAQATRFASERLSEVESRWHYFRELRGQE